MLVVVIGGNWQIKVRQWRINNQVVMAGMLFTTPAGATPMPANPNITVTGLLTVSPSAGETIYNSAPSGAGDLSIARADSERTATENAKYRELLI